MKQSKDEEEVRREDDRFLRPKRGGLRLRKERSRDEEKEGGKLGLREVGFLIDHFGRDT